MKDQDFFKGFKTPLSVSKTPIRPLRSQSCQERKRSDESSCHQQRELFHQNIQQLRWKTRIATGYWPEDVTIPKRFLEITTGKGPMDGAYLASIKDEYAKAIRTLAVPTEGEKDPAGAAGK